MGDRYTKRDRIKAGAYFLYQAITFPIRCFFENYPESFGADFLTPRQCLQRTRKDDLQIMLENDQRHT